MTRPPTDHTAEQIRSSRVIAIVRGTFDSRQILSVAQALRDGGVTAMEVTLNSESALEHIAMLHQEIGHAMLIGAGTVRTPEQVDRAVAAGAQFLISPGFDPASVERSTASGVLHLPGVFTPSEAQQAAAMGCKLLKLFPCDTLTPDYLKALRAPLNDIEFVPTGGIGARNIAAWKRAGAFAVAVGSSLVSGPTQPLDEITLRCKTMRDAWEAAIHV